MVMQTILLRKNSIILSPIAEFRGYLFLSADGAFFISDRKNDFPIVFCKLQSFLGTIEILFRYKFKCLIIYFNIISEYKNYCLK